MSQDNKTQQDQPKAKAPRDKKPQGQPQQQQGGAKQQQQAGKPQQQGGQPRSAAQNGFNKKRNNNGQQPRKQNGPSRSIYINRIFLGDLDGTPIAAQLKQQRKNYIVDVMRKYGQVESVEDQVETASTLIVNYVDVADAKKALDDLRNENAVQDLVDEIRGKLAQSNLSASLCPPLYNYKFGFHHAQSQRKGPKAAGEKGPKTVIANSTPRPESAPSSSSQPPATAAAAVSSGIKQQKPQQPQQQPKQAQPKTEQAQAQPQAAKEQKPKKEKKPQQARPQTAPAQTDEARKAAAEDLRREAEIAKLKEEKQYLTRQQAQVRTQLDTERARVKDRDSRLDSLSQDLERVENEKRRLEAQLSAEKEWKHKGQESISKLEAELHHLTNQYQHVELRLNQVNAH